jgi:hypothetical protein
LQKWWLNDGSDREQYFIEFQEAFSVGFTVLQELSTAKSKSKFQNWLRTFSKSSGRMDALYSEILSRIQEEDQPWVKETLKWIIAAPSSLE